MIRPAGPTAVVVLAAGAGRRLGGRPKTLVRLGQATVLQRVLASAGPHADAGVWVVLGHHAAAIAAALPTEARRAGLSASAHTLPLPDPGDDTAPSLHAALAALPGTVQRVAVLLADQPLLTSEDLGAALAAFDARPPGAHALVPRWRGEPGHPVVLDAAAVDSLRQRGSGGVKAWRREHPGVAFDWDAPNDHGSVDLDTVDDVQRVAAQLGGLAWALPDA